MNTMPKRYRIIMALLIFSLTFAEMYFARNLGVPNEGWIWVIGVMAIGGAQAFIIYAAMEF
jgi:hypothetical protein